MRARAYVALIIHSRVAGRKAASLWNGEIWGETIYFHRPFFSAGEDHIYADPGHLRACFSGYDMRALSNLQGGLAILHGPRWGK